MRQQFTVCIFYFALYCWYCYRMITSVCLVLVTMFSYRIQITSLFCYFSVICSGACFSLSIHKLMIVMSIIRPRLTGEHLGNKVICRSVASILTGGNYVVLLCREP